MDVLFNYLVRYHLDQFTMHMSVCQILLIPSGCGNIYYYYYYYYYIYFFSLMVFDGTKVLIIYILLYHPSEDSLQ
jgi:hypothetical protein